MFSYTMDHISTRTAGAENHPRVKLLYYACNCRYFNPDMNIFPRDFNCLTFNISFMPG